jgi:hypothetical protein
MAVDIEPLLQQLAELAPRFGRAQGDLETMVTRGRSHDFKGVMQNARLVLEALLRSIITEELKQTPGKAMLDELVTRFRQQANAGIIPTNILAHMGTVQAWGNLSAHDHAGSLEDSGVKVGQDEVVASLNSMVAILSWYASKKGLVVRDVPPVAKPLPAPTEAPSSLKSKVWVGIGLVFALVALLRPRHVEVETPVVASVKVESFAALDAVYATRKEPVPPAACRRLEEASALAKSAVDAQALGLLEKPSPEAAYLLARVTFDELKRTSPALDVALQCEGFAAAQHLAGLVAIAEGKLPEAQRRLEQARASAPTWLDNRAKLAGVLLQADQRDAAAKEIDGLVAAAPDYAPAYLLRFSLEVLQDLKGKAMADLCKAMALGSAQAREKVDQLHYQCP